MNVFTRGVRGALRSPLRAGAIVIMLAISIGLIVAMLAARAGVDTKISQVKSQSANGITVRPAGINGFGGDGSPLSAAQVTTITKTAHIVKTVSTLQDQMGTTDTNLTPALTLGAFGQRQQRFENNYVPADGQGAQSEGGQTQVRQAPTPRTNVTGTTDPNSVSTNGGSLTLTSGSLIDGSGSAYEALVGAGVATKNNLKIGSTFTGYGKTFTVKGIYQTGNKFQDSGVIMPLAVVQDLTGEPGVSSVEVTADSSDNVATVVNNLKSSLGTAVDITSDQQRAADSVATLGGISNLATTGVIGASVAAAVIVLLTMTMIIRERRREIGVIKAIGGTNGKVIAQFMTEALTLTIIGGIIGIAFGIIASGSITQSLVDSQINTQQTAAAGRGGTGGGNFGGRIARFGGTAQRGLQAVTSSVTPETIAIGAGLTLLIAIVGSAVPAWLIARIRPAEVLRTE